MKIRTNRRHFLKQAGWAAAGLGLVGASAPLRAKPFARKAKIPSANDKLNIGIIGTANRAGANIQGVSSQNIVALCDVDENYLNAAAQKFPAARKYRDFRELLDQAKIDAVVISTPDHTHAVATVMALKDGKHVYCEKPLTHTLSEARIVRETARGKALATQMGNQIHASTNYRRVVELVQSGAIGVVGEVHVWVGRVWTPKPRPIEIIPEPPHLKFDLWLGPARYRPYHPDYLPRTWRGWWAFGGGTLADFGCHYLDLPHWALDLREPKTVEAEGPEPDPEGPPPWLVVRYEHEGRENQPPVTLTWYQGGKRPRHFAEGLLPQWGNGVLFVGSKGMLLADYSKHVLLPESTFVGFQAPAPSIPDSLGHYEEWIQACKLGGKTTCNFEYTGRLTETVHLGNLAHRLGNMKLHWDPAKLRVTNCPEAEEFIQHDYRRGWHL